MSRIALLVLGFGAFSTIAAPPRWQPDVVLSGGRVTGLPASAHKAVKQTMEVLEEERCASGHAGGAVTIPESCGFLRGLYRYSYTPDGAQKPRQVLVEFTVTRAAGRGYGLLVAAPITLAEAKP